MAVIRVPKLTLYGTIDSYVYVEVADVVADVTTNVVADSEVNTTAKKTYKKSKEAK